MSTAANYLRELRLCLGQNEFYEFDEFDRSSAAGGRSGMWVTRANLVSLVSLLVSILHRAFTRGRARMRALNVLRKVIMKLTKLTRTSRTQTFSTGFLRSSDLLFQSSLSVNWTPKTSLGGTSRDDYQW